MRHFWIPAAVLAALLAASLWNAGQIEADVAPWREAVESAVSAAGRGDWDASLTAVRGARDDWYDHHAYFHIVIAHDELDKVDALIAKAESYAVEHDMPEFRAEAAELLEQLDILVETQKLTVRNVL